MLNPVEFIRVPFVVKAVEVTEENLSSVAKWCNGEVRTNEKGVNYIKVHVRRPLNVRQTQAFVGDYVLSAGTGFKVYTSKAFKTSFVQCHKQFDLPFVVVDEMQELLSVDE